jgi:hypothetical protein
MDSYTEVVQNSEGQPVQNAQVYVFLAGTLGATSAVVYSDDGSTVITQPILSDANGRFLFYAANGRYDLRISKPNAADEWVYNEQIYDMSESGAPWFDVTDVAYGAKGDGVTDDSAAVQAAATAASAASGVLYFPPGATFLINSTVALGSNTTLKGKGVIKSGITGTGHVAGFLFYATELSGIVFDGLIINGNAQTSAYNGTAYPGILGCFSSDNVVVKDCHVYDSDGDCLYFGLTSGAAQNTNIRVHDNLLENARRDGIALTCGIGVEITNNRILETYGIGIDIEPNAGETVDRLLVQGNYVYASRDDDGDGPNWSRGLDITTQDGTIGAADVIGNHFELELDSGDLDATSTNRAQLVYCHAIDGPLTYKGNTAQTNALSDAGVNHIGVVTMGASTYPVGNLHMAGNTIFRPETSPVNADGEGFAITSALVLRECDGAKISGDSISGSFDIGLYIRDCDSVSVDIDIRNTADGVSTSVEAAVKIDGSTDILLTGHLEAEDNTIVPSDVDGLHVSGATLKKSDAAKYHLYNHTAASDHFSIVACAADDVTGTWPTSVAAENDDGNAVANLLQNTVYDLGL